MSDVTGFDYGTDEVSEGGGAFKNPEVGDHSARLRSIIHCGMFRETYNKEKKKPAPQVVAIFELKDDEDFEDDGTTPLTMHKTFPLKKGDKAFMTKFIKALDPKGKAKGFDDLVGAACQINCKGGKELLDDGKPKYINFGGISGMPAKFAAMTEDLIEIGVGHIPFDDITKEAIMELHPIREVADIIMEGDRFAGSAAEVIIMEIRAENADFAVRKKKEGDDKKAEGGVDESAAQPEQETNLNDDEEF